MLTLDIGGAPRQIVAGIARHYRPEDLTDKQIVVVTNLEPATLRGVVSDGMLLAAQDGEGIVLLTPDRLVQPGALVR